MDARLLARLQTGVLALGTAFSWFTLLSDYRRFFAAGGRFFELSGCIVANPLATPCFYGAVAFLAAFAWSIAGRPRGLVWLLGAGALFAWGNFAYEVYRYASARPASGFSCPPGDLPVHPLAAPCFYGALFFLTAFVLALLLMHVKKGGERADILNQ